MKPSQLRACMRRYGTWGVCFVACYLGVHYLWKRQRFACIMAAVIVPTVIATRFRPHPAAPISPYHSRVLLRPQRSTRPEEKSAPVPTGEIHVFLTPNTNAKEGWLPCVRAQTEGRTLWQDDCVYGIGYDLPSKRVICYSGEQEGVLARRYDGTILWQGVTTENEVAHLCAGGDALIVTNSGPAWGVSIGDVRGWGGDDGVVANRTLDAYNSRNGAKLWQSDEKRIGFPVWTDGNAVVTVRLDVSDHAIKQAIKYAKYLPVSLEVYRFRDHHLLWSRLLRGYPPELRQVRRVGSHHLEFLFAGEPILNDFPFIKRIERLQIAVPIDSSHLDAVGIPLTLSATK